MAVTIKDVAKRANVAASTVSRVVANSSKISPGTARRVREAITELDYNPNYHARSLVKNTTNTIGIVMPRSAQSTFQNPFFPEVIRGITSEIHDKDIGLYLSTGQTEDEIYNEVVKMVVESRVDGIILLYSQENDRIMPFLLEKNFPFVLIGRPSAHLDQISYVNNDNVKAGGMLTEYLLLLNHKKIGFIGGNENSMVTKDHLKGYTNALAKRAVPFREEYVVYREEIKEGGQEAAIELMSLSSPPTAIIAADDMMAFGVLRMIQDMNKKVPDDVSIVSFNNFMLSELSTPPLTTVDIHIFDLGARAAESLVHLMRSGNKDIQHTIVPHHLVKRSSCIVKDELK
ncbi:LacI family DNA-binding transcriptional regulator [Marinococcus halophilus]|uniref:LacI family DNA-binding transcriptional regulator n=1 Tax=Marinococcus halophilus TaxID=1371 RepID=UPI0009A8562F|nr:LacI family DNA-binding transcriptional regulator [Marinococcus halophilus]